MARPVNGVAFDLAVGLFKNDGTLVANPGTVTAKISKDFGAWNNVGSVTEEDSTYSQLKLALTGTEMTADVVDIYVVDDTANTVPVRLTIYPQEAVLPGNVTQMGGVAQSATDLKDFVDTGYDPATHKVAGVVLADTTTTNSDMRGTNSAALASVCTEGRLAELDAANLPSDVDAIPTTAMRGTDSAATAVSLAAVLVVIQNVLRWFTNKRTVTATAQILYADDETTPLYTQTLADDDTTVTRGEAS